MFATPDGLASWAATLAGFVAGGGMGAALVTTRTDRRQRRRDAVAADVREAQERLDAFRDACRRRGLGLADAPDVATVYALADAVETAARRGLPPAELPPVLGYVRLSVERAKVGNDARAADEEESYEVVCILLARRLAANR